MSAAPEIDMIEADADFDTIERATEVKR